jgi:hypothetical protein
VHYALVRSGNTMRMFRDGVQTASASISVSISNNTLFNVGGNGECGGACFLNGYIDDVRFTRGVARYTANFTPPTHPFPDN